MAVETPTAPRRSRALRPGPWLLAGTAVLVAVHLVLASGVVGPTISQDESGYLGNARWLAGLEPVPEMGDAGIYAWGYSLLIAPLAALIDDPGTLYRAVQVLNALLLSSLFPLLWLMLTRVGRVPCGPALVAAALGAVYPSMLVQSSTAWSENLLAPLTVVLVLAVWAALVDGPWWRRLALAPVAVWLQAAHPRFLPVMVLILLAWIAAGAAGRVPRRLAAIGSAAIVAGWAFTRAVSAALASARWPDRSPDQGSTGRLLGRLVDPSNLADIAGGMIGEGWYLVVASLGLTGMGAVAAVAWVWGARPPARDASPDTRRRSGALGAARARARGVIDDPGRLTAAVVLVCVAALFTTSVLSFVGNAPRVDHRIYGRYNEAFAPVLVAAGAAALLVVRGRAFARLLLVSAALTAGLGALLLARGSDVFDGRVVWNNVLGIRAVSELVSLDGVAMWSTAAAVAALGFLWLAGRATGRRRSAMALGLGAIGVALVVMGAVAVRPLWDFSDVRYDGWEMPGRVERAADAAGVDTLGIAPEAIDLTAVHLYPYWLPDLDVVLLDDATAVEPPGLVLGRPGSAPFGRDAARMVALDARHTLALWAMPGPTLDELASRGAALPDGFPTELPDEARSAGLEVVGDAPGDDAAAIELAGGASASVELAVAHTGAGALWPDDASWPLPGVVRIGHRWLDGDDDPVRDDGRDPLPASMWPGDRREATIEIRAVDAAGEPLAPGPYVVEVDLVQEGFSWFHPSGDTPLRLEVSVTP